MSVSKVSLQQQAIDKMDENKENFLHIAARFLLINSAKNLLLNTRLFTSQSLPINQQNKLGKTPLCVLAEHKADPRVIEIAKIFFDIKADVNIPDDESKTALSGAIINKNYSLIILLLDNGANIHMLDQNCMTNLFQILESIFYENIIHFSVRCSSPESIKKKFYGLPNDERVTKVNQKSIKGKTPLILLSETKEAAAPVIQIAQVLLDNGADPYIPDSSGETPLSKAIKTKKTELVELLIGHIDTTSMKATETKTLIEFLINEVNDTPLHIGARFRSVKSLQHLLSTPLFSDNKIEKMNKRNKNGMTPLMLISKQNSKPCVIETARVLLENGADINAFDPNGNTPLSLATDAKNYELMKLFVDHGANITMRNKNGLSLLHKLAMSPVYQSPLDTEATTILLTGQELPDSYIKSVFQKASELNNKEFMELMKNCGYNLKAPKHFVDYIYDFFVDETDDNFKEIEERLTQMGNKSPEYFQYVLRYCLEQESSVNVKSPDMRYLRSAPVIKLLLEHKVDPNFEDNTNQEMPLNISVGGLFRNVENTKLLIHHGANVNIKNPQSRTPLHFAVEPRFYDEDKAFLEYDLEVLKLLLEKRADTSQLNDSGKAPLHEAVCWTRYPEVVELLLQYRADPNQLTNPSQLKSSRRTPLHEAVDKTRHPKIVELLLQYEADPNKTETEHQQTPLHRAVIRYIDVKNQQVHGILEDCLSMIQSLLNYGAKTDLTDKSGYTPLSIAEKYAAPELVELFTSHSTNAPEKGVPVENEPQEELSDSILEEDVPMEDVSEKREPQEDQM